MFKVFLFAYFCVLYANEEANAFVLLVCTLLANQHGPRSTSGLIFILIFSPKYPCISLFCLGNISAFSAWVTYLPRYVRTTIPNFSERHQFGSLPYIHMALALFLSLWTHIPFHHFVFSCLPLQWIQIFTLKITGLCCTFSMATNN